MHRIFHVLVLGVLLAAVALSWAPGAEVAGTSLRPGQRGQLAPAAAPALGAPAQPDSIERALFELVNADRARGKLPALTLDPALLPIARSRAQEQLTDASLSHYDAQGQLAFVPMLTAASIRYTLAGENLARTSGPDAGLPGRIEEALMRSPTHRRNILDPTFTRLAVGAAWDQSGRVSFAQLFRDTP